MNLHQPLHVLPGVGPKSAEKYAKLGIENLQDLLLYFPFRYEDFKTKQVSGSGRRGKGSSVWTSRDSCQCSVLWFQAQSPTL